MRNHAACLALFASFALAQPDQPGVPPPPGAFPEKPLGTLIPEQPDALSWDAKRDDMLLKAAAYLRSTQAESGGWNIRPGAPVFPAITGLALQGLLDRPQTPENDDAIKRAIAFILSMQQPDGGIYDKVLPTYNTAICLSALTRIPQPSAQVKAAIPRARDFIKGLQYGEGAVIQEGIASSPQKVTKDHAFYGGWGYGNHGRPDLSNTAFMLEALHDSGVAETDPAFQRALVFLQRCQMIEKAPDGTIINAMDYAKGSRQGGFIYSTSVNKDTVGAGQSQTAAMIEETLDDGTNISRLASYGSMTYSGFKSYLYAGLSPQDPRVLAARDWIARNYTLHENPGMGTDGLYYYFLVFARALDTFDETSIATIAPDGSTAPRQWRADLVHRLAELQTPDGSFRSVDDRWMENDPVLITAYAAIALQCTK